MAGSVGGHTRACHVKFTTSVAAAAHARHFVNRQLTAWQASAALTSDAVGCVNKLASLVLADSAGLLTVDLVDDDDYIEIAVTSDGPSVERAPAGPDEYGVRLLNAMADEWGDHTNRQGRSGSWCRLKVDSARP